MRRALRALGNVVGRTIGLAVVWLAAALAVVEIARQFVSHATAAYIAWALATLAVAWMWRYWHRRGRELAAEQRDRELSAGDALRREDLARYRELLDGADDALAITDPDRYVGRLLTAPKPAQRFRWNAPTAAQRATVERLTEELENATLVRTVEDDAAEVLGTKGDVAYRYRVDASGNCELLATDDSKVRMLRWIRRTAVTGVAGFVGSFIPLFILHPDGTIPGWMVPIMLVFFVMAFFGVAASTGPKHFLEPGEHWQEFGSGWDSGD